MLSHGTSVDRNIKLDFQLLRFPVNNKIYSVYLSLCQLGNYKNIYLLEKEEWFLDILWQANLFRMVALQLSLCEPVRTTGKKKKKKKALHKLFLNSFFVPNLTFRSGSIKSLEDLPFTDSEKDFLLQLIFVVSSLDVQRTWHSGSLCQWFLMAFRVLEHRVCKAHRRQ